MRKYFYSTDISVTLWILNNNKKARVENKNDEEVHYRNCEGEMLFIDLRQKSEPFEKKYIQFSSEQIREIADTYITGGEQNMSRPTAMKQNTVTPPHAKR